MIGRLRRARLARWMFLRACRARLQRMGRAGLQGRGQARQGMGRAGPQGRGQARQGVGRAAAMESAYDTVGQYDATGREREITTESRESRRGMRRAGPQGRGEARRGMGRAGPRESPYDTVGQHDATGKESEMIVESQTERRRAALEAVFEEMEGHEEEFLQDGSPRVENVNTRLSARGEQGGATRREISETFDTWKKRREPDSNC
jgi:hypothetical protein